jgi:hypothetical protein
VAHPCAGPDSEWMTSAVTALTNVGFTATTAEMLASTTYREIRIALRAGSIDRSDEENELLCVR